MIEKLRIILPARISSSALLVGILIGISQALIRRRYYPVFLSVNFPCVRLD